MPDSIEVAEPREHLSPRPLLVPTSLDQGFDLAFEVEAKLFIHLASHPARVCAPVRVQAVQRSVIVHVSRSSGLWLEPVAT
jgi:hypothetical protein